MNRKIFTNFLIIFLFTANQVFAAAFYSEKKSSKTSTIELVGDLSFSYSTVIKVTQTQEILEYGLTRVIVDRNSRNPRMIVEQKTKSGFLYLTYLGFQRGWENTKVSFRPYEVFYKDLFDDTCSSMTSPRNQSDLGDLKKRIEVDDKKKKETDYLAQLIFDKSCGNMNLSDKESKDLKTSTYTLLAGDQQELNALVEPLPLTCVTSSAEDNPLRMEFQQLRNKIAIIKNDSYDTATEKKDINVPFRISCDFDGAKKEKCGMLKEGPKSQISFDVSCLRRGPKSFATNVQATFMHEFMHTIRVPQDPPETPQPFSEEEVLKVDQGICEFPKKIFAAKSEILIADQKITKALNAQQTGHKNIGNDVINPYAAFKAPQEGPTVTGTSASSVGPRVAATSLRSVASAGQTSINISVPRLDTLALPEVHYQAVKRHVNTTIAAISKKIAPVVAYVESPAFAADLGKPPTEVPPMKPNSPSTGNSPLHPGETATGTDGGPNPVVLSQKQDLKHGKAPHSGPPKDLSSTKLQTRPIDLGLDNALAVNIRKKIILDAKYAAQLRQNGVNIKFEDGTNFESATKTIHYIEKNGVLLRGK